MSARVLTGCCAVALVVLLAYTAVLAGHIRPAPGPTVQRTGTPATPFITISTGVRP